MTNTDPRIEAVAKALYIHMYKGQAPSWEELPEWTPEMFLDMARAALAAADLTEPRFPAPDFEWDVDAVIEAREDAGEPGDQDTAQRVVNIAHDVLLTFKYTLQTYPFSDLNTVVWLVSEMVRIAEVKAADAVTDRTAYECGYEEGLKAAKKEASHEQ